MPEIIKVILIVSVVIGLLAVALFVLAQVAAAYFEEKWNENLDNHEQD